jgi:hypothetical protein
MAPKHVAFVGAICVTIGWLLASTLSPPVARVQSLPPQRQDRATATPADVVVTEQVRLPIQLVPSAPEGRRNLFAFATRDPAQISSRQEIAPAESVPEIAPVVTGPVFILSGVGISGATRTAVLATDDAVNIVKLNDVIGDYTVTDITDHTVTLTRGDARYTLRLAQ